VGNSASGVVGLVRGGHQVHILAATAEVDRAHFVATGIVRDRGLRPPLQALSAGHHLRAERCQQVVDDPLIAIMSSG